MRVKISANPPLPPLRAWIPVSTQPTVSAFKALLCTSVPAFRSLEPSSLRLSIDDFDLLDDTELTVVRDGDLVCVDVRGCPGQGADEASRATQARLEPASCKRKRRTPTPSSSDSESDTDTEASTSTSDSDDSSRPRIESKRRVVQPSTFVPPGYGKPQTRSRNLRRRLKRMHEREGAVGVAGGPVSGANAVTPGEMPANGGWTLASLSLRNKNKARNFRSLMNRPLPANIIFDQEKGDGSPILVPPVQGLPRLIPPSSRSSLPPNLFVTSVDVEDKRSGRVCDEPEVTAESEVDVDGLELMAEQQWATLQRPTTEKGVTPGMIVGYKALGIHAATCTPEQLLTLVCVVSCEAGSVMVRPLRARPETAFGGPVDDGAEVAVQGHTWDEIERGDWRILG